MEKAVYKKKADSILNEALKVEDNFLSFVNEYYKEAPREVGKKSTEFYRHISTVLDSIERSVYRMRTKLNDPDMIERIETKK